MRHDWIFDVLSDLHAYAESNELPELEQSVKETLRIARQVIEQKARAAESAARHRALRRAQ